MWPTDTEDKAFVFYTRKHHTFTVCSHTNDYRRLFYRDIEICPQKYTTVWDIVNKQKKHFFFLQQWMQGTKLPILKEMNDI